MSSLHPLAIGNDSPSPRQLRIQPLDSLSPARADRGLKNENGELAAEVGVVRGHISTVEIFSSHVDPTVSRVSWDGAEQVNP